MADKTLTWKQECQDCDTTGLFLRFNIPGSGAVECPTCKGTGAVKMSIKYRPFTGRRHGPIEVKTVYRVIGALQRGKPIEPEMLDGGTPIEEWLNA